MCAQQVPHNPQPAYIFFMHEARRARHDRAARRERRERQGRRERRERLRRQLVYLRSYATAPPLQPTEDTEAERAIVRFLTHAAIVVTAALVVECWWPVLAAVAAAVVAAAFTELRGYGVLPARGCWYHTWPAHAAMMAAIAAAIITSHKDCFLVFCGGAMLAKVLFIGCSVGMYHVYCRGTMDAMDREQTVLIALQLGQWCVLSSGVLVAALHPADRVYALLGCQYGLGMTLLLLEVNPVALWRQTQGTKELRWLRWGMAVSWAVAVAMVPLHDYAAWFSLVPVAWALVGSAGLAAAAGAWSTWRWLGWSCRVAWHGVPCAPQDAVCCICWEHPGPGATLCIRCGVGTPDPMSFACEECRDTWLQHENTCPICRTEDWPVVFPVSP